MRIGVICEGPSDYPAIVHFTRSALAASGINAEYVPLAPEMDKTRPEGGWGLVLNWLNNHPPRSRVEQYFGGGLFGGSLARDPLDALIIQLDTDVLENKSFRQYVNVNYSVSLETHTTAQDRANQIGIIINKASALSELTQADANRHVPFAAVESTETWCVAAFSGQRLNTENIKGSDLTNAFMRALEASESKTPQVTYSNVDKSHQRREAFCRKHAANSNRIVADCPQFARGIEHLKSIAS